MAAILKT